MSTPDVFDPADLGPVRLRNRTVKAATFASEAHNSALAAEKSAQDAANIPLRDDQKP